MNKNYATLRGDDQDAYSEYTEAHTEWMNTPLFHERHSEVKARLDVAREKYLQAVKARNPTWIVM